MKCYTGRGKKVLEEWSGHELCNVLERKKQASTQHQAQRLPSSVFQEHHLLHDLHTIHTILATEKKISLAEKSEGLKSSGVFFKIPYPAHKKSSSIKICLWLQLTQHILQPKIDPLFVFRGLGSFSGNSTSDVPELGIKKTLFCLVDIQTSNIPTSSLIA